MKRTRSLRGSFAEPRHRSTLAWLWLLCTGCCADPPSSLPRLVPDGLEHRAGSSFVQARAHYGVPILQKSIFWDGNGEVDNFGPGAYVFHHLTDAVAIGAGGNLTTWLTPGHDVYSAEVEALLRTYPVCHCPLFLDLTGGFVQATDPVPPAGTEWNFSFSFGPGLELPTGKGTALLVACDYHHISNALGRDSSRNPSQNEARAWIGYAWTF